MSHHGLGVMIQSLFGGRGDVEEMKMCVGKKIMHVAVGDSVLTIDVEGGKRLVFEDDGQSCCEQRYMTADGNDLSYYVGAEFMDAQIKEADDAYYDALSKKEYAEAHEVEFLIIKTSKGEFTIANHNEHNGYYGGFWIKVSVKQAQ